MDEKKKAALISMMESFPKGAIGGLSIEVEETLCYIPVPSLCSWMALELIVESNTRARGKVVSSGLEAARDEVDVIREYMRSLTDEEFYDFVSTEKLTEAFNMAKQHMGHKCYGCGNCGGSHDDPPSDDGKDPDKGPLMN